VSTNPPLSDYPLEAQLLELLARSRELGFLGPGPVEAQLSHAASWPQLIPEGSRVLDLGSGGGLPGLVISAFRSDLDVTLMDAHRRRVEFLLQAVADLGLTERARAICGRAEALVEGRRNAFDIVVARSFAAPAVTAECAAPFLRVGGRLLVSEPMTSPRTWPVDGLLSLGMRADRRVVGDQSSILVIQQVTSCPDRFPRRIGVAAKRPLFHVEHDQ